MACILRAVRSSSRAGFRNPRESPVRGVAQRCNAPERATIRYAAVPAGCDTVLSMSNRTPRFISQFAALQKERASRPPNRWRMAVLGVLLVGAAALALYDMLR